MRHLKIILTTVMAVVFFALPAAAFDKYSVNRNDLPEKAQQFLTEYFPKGRVSKKTDYDVKLTNGTKIEFNNKGEWTSVDCKTREVPSGLIIKNIRNYVAKNFPDTFIVKIEKKSLSYEIELNDGIELKFDRLGTFKSAKMDD